MGPAAQHLFSVQPYKVWGVIRCGGRAPEEPGGCWRPVPFPGLTPSTSSPPSTPNQAETAQMKFLPPRTMLTASVTN